MVRGIVTCGVAAIALGFISQFARKPAAPLPAADSPPPVLENVGPPVDEQEAMQFGLQLETAVAERDTAAVERLVPIGPLYDRAVSDLDTTDVPPVLRQTFCRRFTREVMTVLDGGGSYKLVRVHTVAGRPRLFFRITTDRGGMGYDDITLARDAAGRVVLDDVCPVLTGEPFGQRMRRLTLDYLSGTRPAATERERLLRKHDPDLAEFFRRVQDGPPTEALAVYRKLPDLLRRDRDTQLRAVQAAQRVSDDVYVREIRAYRHDHPDTPGLDLLSLDEYLLTEDWGPALAALTRVEKAVGGDPCLSAVRALVLARTGSPAAARAIAERAVKEEPTLTVAYWACVAVAYMAEDHPAALKWLKAVHERRHVPLDFAAIVINPASKPFARSPEFQQLKAWYAKRGK